MKITTTKTVTESVELELPKFYKKPPIGENIEYTALLDEETVVHIFVSKDLTIIKNCDHVYANVSNIVNYEEVTEDEFMAEFQKAYKSISLSPIYKAGPRPEFDDLKNQITW